MNGTSIRMVYGDMIKKGLRVQGRPGRDDQAAGPSNLRGRHSTALRIMPWTSVGEEIKDNERTEGEGVNGLSGML